MNQNSKIRFVMRLGIRMIGVIVILFGFTSLNHAFNSLGSNNMMDQAKYDMVVTGQDAIKVFYKDMVDNKQKLIDNGQLEDYMRGVSELSQAIEKLRVNPLEPRVISILFFIVELLLGMYLILSAIGLMRIKEEGRKNTVIGCILMMGLSFIFFPRINFTMSKANGIFEKANYMNTFFYPEAETLSLSGMSYEMLSNPLFASWMIGYFVLLLLPMFILTRPKIKEQFQ